MIFVLSGPSGSGKTTLRDLLLKDKALRKLFVKSISLTTRPMRPGEREGRDYFFINESTFNNLRKNKRILEWTKYLGYYYGTKKDLLEGSLDKGKNIVLCLDFKGARRIKTLYPQKAVTIFILPPSLEELRNRIEKRALGTKKQEISRRIMRAAKELKNMPEYDYALKNINLIQAVKKLKGIILKKAIK
jgi:guanylate kinase